MAKNWKEDSRYQERQRRRREFLARKREAATRREMTLRYNPKEFKS